MSTTHATHHDHPLTDTRWRLDPSAASAEFRVPNLWRLASVKGHFERIEGSLEIDDADQWHIVLNLDAASLDTGNPRRDKHLRSADFFDVENHPVVRFLGRNASDHGDGRLHVAGELQAAGERVPLDVEVSITHADGRLELDATAIVDQRQLGMTWSPLGMVKTPTALRLCARLRPE